LVDRLNLGLRFLALLFNGDNPPLDPHQSIGERFVVAAREPHADHVSGNAADAR
jgi:hypothetical protein